MPHYLIAGLGNPGPKYEKNRHNIGFLVIDYLLSEIDTNLIKNKFNSFFYKQENLFFAKPQTFMNSSGEAISKIKNFYKIDNCNIIIVHDDLDLPFGAIKFKIGGGNGGHNGLKSIDKYIGNDYIRVRIGIGRPKEKNEVVNYVLSDFSESELQKLYLDIIPHTKKAIYSIIKNSLDFTKSNFTKK